jgi:hypothetical protein
MEAPKEAFRVPVFEMRLGDNLPARPILCHSQCYTPK